MNTATSYGITPIAFWFPFQYTKMRSYWKRQNPYDIFKFWWIQSNSPSSSGSDRIWLLSTLSSRKLVNSPICCKSSFVWTVIFVNSIITYRRRYELYAIKGDVKLLKSMKSRNSRGNCCELVVWQQKTMQPCKTTKLHIENNFNNSWSWGNS